MNNDPDRADFDDLAWDKHDEDWEQSQKLFRRVSMVRKVESLLTQKFGRTASWVSPMRIGGYNNLYRMQIEGLKDNVMIRLPQPNLVQFPDEKTISEAATACFIALNSAIPVPKVFFHGTSTSDPDIGPFTVLEFVENCGSISHALKMPNEKDPDAAHMLDPKASEYLLQDLYGKIATNLLQLFKYKFPCIGSLAQTENGFSVSGRPITQNMNNMLQLANIPRAALPLENKIYVTADQYYIALAEMHTVQLVFQHNDLVKSADDCRNKYIARLLFHKLATQGRLSIFGFVEDDWSTQSKNQPSILSAPSGTHDFRIWCDDFRPSNILLNEANEIVAIIDWEFAYVAPTQFALDPPWWLLLNVPEMWHTNIGDWTKIYNERLIIWLRAVEIAELKIDIKFQGVSVSEYMRESWDTGRFWLNYAARKSWAFDTIYWKYLDERFFGEREKISSHKQEYWETRMHLLSEVEKGAMDAFVEKKMEESKERTLVDWNEEQIKARLKQVFA